MKDSQLIRTLKVFNDDQWSQIEKFLASPFFNNELEKGSSLSFQLFCYLKEQRKEWDVEKLEKNFIAATFSKGEHPFRGQIEKVMSSLNKLVKKYISFSYNPIFNNTDAGANVGLLNFYKTHGMDDKFLTESQKCREHNKLSKLQDENTLWEAFLIERSILEFENFMNLRFGDVNLTNTINSLDLYYLTTKLKLSSLLYQQSKFVELPISSLIPHEILTESIASYPATAPIAKAYALAIELINNEVTPEFIEKYINFLGEISDKAPKSDLRNLYGFLRNYYISRYNKGESQYLNALFGFYKEEKNMKILFEENGIHHSTFTNIVFVGLKLHEFDWVISFIEANKDFIIGHSNPSEVIKLNSANYYFHKKKYIESWELLQWNYDSAYYKIAAKKIEMKILFEQKEFNLLDSRVNAFKVYLSRASTKIISTSKKLLNSAFINFLSQIINPSTMHNPTRIRKIQQKIIARKALSEREWLLEKIEELLKK